MKTRKIKIKRWRFPRITFLVFLFVFLILFIQLSYLTLSPNIYGINMKDFAAMRNTISGTLPASRGNIFDVNGQILAHNVSSYTVIAYLDESRTGNSKTPLHVVDKKNTAKKISEILDYDYDNLLYLLETFSKRGNYQVELAHGISEMQKEALENENLPGIDFVENYKRYYPNGDFASYVIGYAKTYENVSKDEDGYTQINYDIVGELGIEAKYDDILKGEDGYLSYQKDRNGYKIPDTPEERIEPKNGVDIYLTIDSNIQRFVESAVKDVSKKYEPEWMILTVMDAKTGDILGASSTPSFDPNIREIENYENLFVSLPYEPGSTMKTYTYMCAIEKGTYDGSATYKSGSVDVEGTIISDWNSYGWGNITFDKGYEYSSNTAIANILDRFIDKNDLKECFASYGFGSKTNIELPRESEGNTVFEYPVEVAAAGFGQGITTTPVQNLRALSIIANDGRMLSPHIVDKIVDPNTNEVLYESKTEQSEQVVSISTVNKMRELMYNTVHGNDPGTTATYYNIEGINVIGKTGTAQIYNNETGSYIEGSYIYSFSGMFPYENPEYIIYASVKRPNIRKSSIVAEAVNFVTESIVKYKNIKSTDDSKNKKFEIQNYQNQQLDSVLKTLNGTNITPIVIGDGNVIIDQYPNEKTQLINGDKLFLLTNGNNITMPNIIGWSRRDVLMFSTLANLDYNFTGYGYAVKQNIIKDTTINSNMKLEVSFEEKNIIKKEDLE